MLTHPDSSDRLHRSHIMQYRWGYCKLGVPLRILQVTVPLRVLLSQKLQHTLNSIRTFSNLSGTAPYETYIASQWNLDVYSPLAFLGTVAAKCSHNCFACLHLRQTWQVEQKPGGRGRAREWATLGVHPLSWLLSNNQLEEVCGTLTKGTFSSRLLLSNQDKGCTPSVAHSLPLPLGPALLNLWIYTRVYVSQGAQDTCMFDSGYGKDQLYFTTATNVL